MELGVDRLREALLVMARALESGGVGTRFTVVTCELMVAEGILEADRALAVGAMEYVPEEQLERVVDDFRHLFLIYRL